MSITNMIGDFFLWGFAFIFSTTVHEASHGYVAKLGGDLTAYSAGQVSLNPLPHIKREPFGMVLFPVLSFIFYGGGWMLGWASVPYDPAWAARHPRKSAWMALAGPVSNLCIFIVSFLLLKLGLDSGLLISAADTASVKQTIAELLYIMAQLNLILAIFNLIPFPPMDGSEAILLLVPEERANDFRMKIQSLGMFGFFIAIVVFSSVYAPIQAFIFQFL
ncbi:MAG: hypothetical protein CR997_05505 [Acidobacteria bacterium]|nr:MAG: hypothetical protein CR997_05505 [Acidobacteriota bacterium]